MKYKNIVFDFDGVLAESNHIRVDGFRELFKAFPQDKVAALVQFAHGNGGISRYAKIRYFFDELLGQPISEPEVLKWAARYSDIVKDQVIKAKPVDGALAFLEKFKGHYPMAIISGSDQEELRAVCTTRSIAHYFTEILGSPLTKNENFKILFAQTGWNNLETVFVGDSINDWQAAMDSNVPFIGRTSGAQSWDAYPIPCINSIMELESKLT